MLCLFPLITVRLGPSVNPALVRALRRGVRSVLIRPNVLSGDALFFLLRLQVMKEKTGFFFTSVWKTTTLCRLRLLAGSTFTGLSLVIQMEASATTRLKFYLFFFFLLSPFSEPDSRQHRL